MIQTGATLAATRELNGLSIERAVELHVRLEAPPFFW